MHWNRQRPSSMPSHRYRPHFERVPVPLVERSWPTAHTTVAPLWVPVDLARRQPGPRRPMDPARKRTFFELMVRMGYKEIEVGYPSAAGPTSTSSATWRSRIWWPDDVTIVVFTAAVRSDRAPFESVRGLAERLVHMYTATAPTWRDVVLGHDREALQPLDLRRRHGRRARRRRPARRAFRVLPRGVQPDRTRLRAAGVRQPHRAVGRVPGPSGDPTCLRPWRSRRPCVCGPDRVHAPQPDPPRIGDPVGASAQRRGTGVACAELAVLAGAQRVEGCLSANGERTGNVDLGRSR